MPRKPPNLSPEALEHKRAHNRANSHKYRASQTPDYWRQRRYGVTPEQYAAMLERQNGACAICLQERKLHVDHCAKTAVVRGLLCMPCNTSIGKLGHDPVIFNRAISYVRGEILDPKDCN